MDREAPETAAERATREQQQADADPDRVAADARTLEVQEAAAQQAEAEYRKHPDSAGFRRLAEDSAEAEATFKDERTAVRRAIVEQDESDWDTEIAEEERHGGPLPA